MATSINVIPKHLRSNSFLKNGLFDNLKRFSDLEKRISKLPNDKERGDAFEVFAEAYLATQTIMQGKGVFPFDKIPAPIKRKFRLDTKRDMGVDGLLQTTTGEHHAYQVKFRSGRPSLTWRELATFVGSSKKTDKGLVFTNCNVLPSNVEDMEEVYSVRGNDLDRLEPRDFQQILNWLKKTPKPKPRKEPHDFQQEAIGAIEKALKGSSSKRATAVMACGTGKTLIALWVAEKLGYKKVLVLLPSLALLSQTLHEWMKETTWDNFSYLCVCSDPTVTKGVDNWVVRQSVVDFPVGTESEVVKEFLAKRTGGVKVVFSTYKSAKVVADGLDSKSFDLGIFDEAHKTASRKKTNFSFALDDNKLSIKRRLFLTATPRHYNVREKDKEGESKLVYSMDDPSTYGKKVYELPFYEASKRGIICDYKVLISVVTSDELNEELLHRGAVVVKGDLVRARQVANQLALKRATEKYPIKKAFTFHTFVKYAASFTAEGGEGIKAHLPSFNTFHVSGAMPTAHREELLHEFEDSRRAVISNARCLTEGVNVPVVDMVAFISPKKSKVDIVQATGRAMRKAGRKKIGYILIPLFLQKTKNESIEEAVERTDFSEVWDVLQAMKEQDAELAEIIRLASVRKGDPSGKGNGGNGFQKKVEILGLDLDILREAITARCIEKLAVSWDVRYGELMAYKDKYGDCNVSELNPEYKQLGRWCGHQRQYYRKGVLSLDRVRRLEDIGFSWEILETRWEEMFKELVAYKKKHGDCNVPEGDPEYMQLGLWVAVQRRGYRAGKLSKKRIERLEELGVVWAPVEAHWEERYQELVKYKKEHGDCDVSQIDPEYGELGFWVGLQRSLYRKGRLSREKVKRLERRGIVWDPDDAKWEEMYRGLVAFEKKHGHCNVPIPKKASRFDRWVTMQRTLYRQGRLSPERIQRLEARGFVWDAGKVRWDEKYQELIEYKKKYGDCNVPARWPENLGLAIWVRNQRKDYRNKEKRLSEEKLSMLEDLGFKWNPLEAKWEEMFNELVAYKKKHGDCSVSQKNPEYWQLGNWVVGQRKSYRAGMLSKEKIKRLERLGIVWDPKEDKWEEKYRELVRYKKKNGNCLVPEGYPENPRLSKWVAHQRYNYRIGTMRPDRIKRLEKMGFEWEPLKRT